MVGLETPSPSRLPNSDDRFGFTNVLFTLTEDACGGVGVVVVGGGGRRCSCFAWGSMVMILTITWVDLRPSGMAEIGCVM